MTKTVSTPGAGSGRLDRMVRVAVSLTLFSASTVHAEDEWVFVASPNSGAFSNQLFAVAGASSQDLWAVGVSTSSLLDKPDTLAMRWNGETWTIVPTPNPNPSFQSNRLYDVTVIDPGDAWAVGSATFGATTSPLLLHWDGTRWTTESAAGLPPSSAHAVHALASDDVWVMGAITQGGTGFSTLAAHYDGSSWTPMSVPNAAFGGLQFQAVDGLASDDVWAAGFENPGNGIFAPLLAHWDGTEWTSLNPQPINGSTLHGIEMIASDDVWAVGQRPMTGNGDQPYAVHWDGASWTEAPMPLFGDGSARLEGVVARAGDDVWAAGTKSDRNGVPRPLIMHYDGAQWSEVTTLSSGGSHEWFHGMAGTPDGEVWAVGQYFTGSATSTLTARLTPTTASVEFRNAGTNPASYTASAPVLGGVFDATVDLASTGHGFALILGFKTPLTLPLAGGQTLLVNVADPAGELLGFSVQTGPLASFSTPVPSDPAFCGFTASSQAVHFGGVPSFALSNAQDLTVGH